MREINDEIIISCFKKVFVSFMASTILNLGFLDFHLLSVLWIEEALTNPYFMLS